MKAKYKEYADTIKKLQDDIAGREQSLAEELRAMGRTGMSDVSAWRDLRKEAQEYELAAKNAAKAGDFDEALKLADKAKSKYKELNTEVKVGDKVVHSKAAALRDTMSNVKRTGELSIDILKQQKEAAEKAAKALDTESGGKLSGAFEKAKEEAKALQKVIQDSEGDWGQVWDAMSKDAKRSIDTTEEYVVKLTKDREIKVDAKLTPAAKRILKAFDELPGVTVKVPGYSTGTVIPGYGGGDRHFSALESGEGVVNKEAVRSLGPRFIHMINSLKSKAGDAVRQRMAAVSIPMPTIPAIRSSVAGASSSGMVNLSLDFKQVAGPAVHIQANPTNAREIQRQFIEMSRLSS